MIERQGVDTSSLGVQDTRTVQASDPGVAALRSNYGGSVGDAGWRGRMLEGLGAKLADAGQAYLKQQQEAAYLEGQAKVGQIASEDELQGSFLTRDWAVAGYRDTQAKLALADSEARLAVDMKDLRTKSPEEMRAYLTKRREELTPTLESMSREGRAQLFKQLSIAEQTGLIKHKAEHRAYIIESTANGIKANAVVNTQRMKDARDAAMFGNGSPEDYLQVAKASVDSFYSDVWENPRLEGSPEVQQKLTMEFLEDALANRHTNVYELLRNKEVDLGMGRKGSVLASLGDGNMVKLSNAYRSAMNDTVAERNLTYITQKAVMEEEFKAGTYKGTWADVQQFVNTGVAHGVLDTGKAESLIQEYAKYQFKVSKEAGLAEAATTGNSQYILSQGSSYKDATDALEARMMRADNGNPLPVPVQVKQLALAMNNGNPEAAKRIGSRMGVALMQMSRPDGTLDPQHAETVQAVLTELGNSRDSKVAEINMLSGMTDEQREKFSVMRALRESGVTAEVASTRADAEVLANAKLTPAERAGRAAAKATEYVKELESLKGRGIFKTMVLGIGALFGGSESAAALKTRPFAPIFGDNQTVGKFEQDLYTATALTLEKVKIKNPGMSPADAVSAAVAEVSNRTVPTKYGPLIMPDGYDHQKFFGVGPAYSPEVVGRAIEKVLTPSQKGNQFEFDVTPQGIRITERTPQGGIATLKDALLDPKSVAAAAKEVADERTSRMNQVHGAGKTVRYADAAVTFNGENTAAIDPALMYRFRDNLVTNEGVRSSVYTIRGIKTVGVGIANEKYWPQVLPNGQVSKSEIDRTFRDASNDAALTGMRMQQKLGLKSDAAFLLFSEFAYQGMGGTFSDMAVAIQRRDEETALAKLRTTRAYEYSAESRRKHYERLVKEALKG